MRLVCPSCGAIHSIEAFLNDEQARKFLSEIIQFDASLQVVILPYLSLFRPENGKGLRWSRALKLLEELKRLIFAEYIEWDKKKRLGNDLKYWEKALERVVDNPPRRLPLKNHNYLRVIAYEIAEEEDKKLEIERERMRRMGYNRLEEESAEGEDGKYPSPEAVRELVNSVLKKRRV